MGFLKSILLSSQFPWIVEIATLVPPNHMPTSGQPTELMPPTLTVILKDFFQGWFLLRFHPQLTCLMF